MEFSEIPDGLHSLQLARGLCENTLGLPAIKSNLELVSACIEAVGKKMFKGRADELKVATYWLSRRLEEAQAQGQKITTHFLRNGEYWGVEKSKSMPGVPAYEHHGEGYGLHDIEWLIREWAREPNPELRKTDTWYEQKLQLLDKKRGRVPAWRL